MTDREKTLTDIILGYDTYEKKEGISASQLSNPALQLKLSKDYPNHISDVKLNYNLASMIGTGFHLLCESALKDRIGLVTEGNLKLDIDGEPVTGTFDLVDLTPMAMYDHKTMQSWKANILYDPEHKDHINMINSFVPQMSQLKYLWEETEDEELTSVSIIVWVVDWKKPYIRKDGTAKVTAPKYFVLEIPTMDKEEFLEYYRAKVSEVNKDYSEQTMCQDCSNGEGWRYDYCDYKSICQIMNQGF